MNQSSPPSLSPVQKVVYNLALATMISILIQTCVFLFWLWWPYKLITINNLQVLGPQVVAGSRLVLKMDYCKPRGFSEDLVAQVQYSFHDDVGYGLLGQTSSWLLPGCGSSAEIVPVPMLPPGKYKLEVTRIYQVNFLRTVVVQAVSNEFQIVMDK